eukprot:UN12073
MHNQVSQLIIKAVQLILSSSKSQLITSDNITFQLTDQSDNEISNQFYQNHHLLLTQPDPTLVSWPIHNTKNKSPLILIFSLLHPLLLYHPLHLKTLSL